MADVPPKLVSHADDDMSSLSAEEALKERQRRREAEREALIADTHQREALLLEDTRELFSKLAAYLKGELSTTTEEYKLLERMNLVTCDKYADMTAYAETLVNNMRALQEKYSTFEPQLKKIDEIETSLTELEKTLNALDAYTLRLENKFRHLKESKKLPYKKLPPSHNI